MSEAAIERRNGLYGFEYLVDDPDKRRKPDRKRRDIKQLWQRSHEIVNLSARGFKNTEIAEILNLSIWTVSDTLSSELAQHKLSELRRCRDEETKVVQEKIRVITNKALKTYNEIFDDEQELTLKEKGNFATTFLKDMSGLAAPTRVQSTHASLTLSKEDLNAFKARALDEAEKAGIIIDVEKPKEITNEESTE